MLLKHPNLGNSLCAADREPVLRDHVIAFDLKADFWPNISLQQAVFLSASRWTGGRSTSQELNGKQLQRTIEAKGNCMIEHYGSEAHSLQCESILGSYKMRYKRGVSYFQMKRISLWFGKLSVPKRYFFNEGYRTSGAAAPRIEVALHHRDHQLFKQGEEPL